MDDDGLEGQEREDEDIATSDDVENTDTEEEWASMFEIFKKKPESGFSMLGKTLTRDDFTSGRLAEYLISSVSQSVCMNAIEKVVYMLLLSRGSLCSETRAQTRGHGCPTPHAHGSHHARTNK